MSEPIKHGRIVVRHFGDAAALRRADTAAPAPGPGQARIRVLAAGVGRTDVMAREGEYLFQRRRPFTPGYELVGEVIDHHADAVPPWLVPGARVAACLPRMGGYTECANLPVHLLAPIPDGLDTLAAAALPLDYLTALSLLDRHGRARPGDTVLVHGATGGVGDALCQLGTHRRLAMYGTASERSLHRLRGYDIVPIDYRQEDVARVVRARHPEGVRIVYDHLGGPSLRAGHRLLAPGGTLVSYAFAARPGHVLADTVRGALHNRLLNLLPGKRTAICSLPREITADPSRHRKLLTHLFELALKQDIRPRIGACFPLAQAAEAHRALERRQVAGKIILTMS
ncbi:quinone oxidoreductase family protein [Nonomuraea diastatica]|uniref:Oxidoreductase n=1 Tax=Nonomuraea diastatica TaxID=1848329 RepID=A0A4R4WVD2_9ACTN|nr:zinc-binding dehydrogenase [Nonomuraea diastatica]TDD21588.1 oxidoreductase [Nonomuraea diastatica]